MNTPYDKERHDPFCCHAAVEQPSMVGFLCCRICDEKHEYTTKPEILGKDAICRLRYDGDLKGGGLGLRL